MSSLTTIFIHLYAYLLTVLRFVFGIKVKPTYEPVYDILDNINDTLFSLFTEEQINHIITVRPILMLFIGVFVLGSIIGLVHRLVK